MIWTRPGGWPTTWYDGFRTLPGYKVLAVEVRVARAVRGGSAAELAEARQAAEALAASTHSPRAAAVLVETYQVLGLREKAAEAADRADGRWPELKWPRELRNQPAGGG